MELHEVLAAARDRRFELGKSQAMRDLCSRIESVGGAKAIMLAERAP
jgi:hypothetical protein